MENSVYYFERPLPGTSYVERIRPHKGLWRIEYRQGRILVHAGQRLFFSQVLALLVDPAWTYHTPRQAGPRILYFSYVNYEVSTEYKRYGIPNWNHTTIPYWDNVNRLRRAEIVMLFTQSLPPETDPMYPIVIQDARMFAAYRQGQRESQNG